MLESIWFALWGILWAVYFMLDGFDLGLGTLMPFLAKNDTERRIIYNAMGPFWDGNEVWLITAGGAIGGGGGISAAAGVWFLADGDELIEVAAEAAPRGIRLRLVFRSADPEASRPKS